MVCFSPGLEAEYKYLKSHMVNIARDTDSTFSINLIIWNSTFATRLKCLFYFTAFAYVDEFATYIKLDLVPKAKEIVPHFYHSKAHAQNDIVPLLLLSSQ